MIAISRVRSRDPGTRRSVEGTSPPAGAWVLTVRVTVAVFVDEVKAIVEGLKLQVLCEGSCEHKLGVSALEPLKPFWAVKVNIVDPA